MANILTASADFKKKFLQKVDFFKQEPVIAGMQLLECDFPPVQRMVLRNLFTTHYQMMTAARGIGKTYLAAVEGLLTAILVPNSRILFVGPTFRSAKIIFTEAENIIRKSPKAQIWIKKIVHLADVWTISCINGSVLSAMPLASESESSIRGFRAHLILADEVPHIPQDTFDLVLIPMLSTVINPMSKVRKIERYKQQIQDKKISRLDLDLLDANKLFGFTSAYFKFNHAYSKILEFDKMREESLEKGFTPRSQTYNFSYMDIPDGFLDMNLVEMGKRNMADFHFRMEWLSEWQSDSNGFYSAKMLDECIGDGPNKYYPELAGDRNSFYIMGIDPARTHDRFSITIAKEQKGVFKVVRVITFKNKNLNIFILKEFRQFLRDYPNVIRIYMDDGGGGLHFKDLIASQSFLSADELPILDMDDEQTRGVRGKRMLKMIHFNPQWSTDYNFAFRAQLEHKGVLFPLNSKMGNIYIKSEEDARDLKDIAMVEVGSMMKEVQSILVTTTPGGLLHFDGPKKDSDIDRYTSTLLCFAAFRDIMFREPTKVEMAEGGWATEMVRQDLEEGTLTPLGEDGVVMGEEGEEIFAGGQ